ncbi:hypothetical protein T10_8942 [Trichinella papuae]|uniref:Uncharacterized protein n=1 Tax=Trichinella papuae TaxID=268474 RepID=A0A0V1M604_9BILA|nr:hypothetical protein T10_6687 [Trichinella papuae]KRZ69261.1 hypothetical protein T10_8942 [Trichinella papuae]
MVFNIYTKPTLLLTNTQVAIHLRPLSSIYLYTSPGCALHLIVHNPTQFRTTKKKVSYNEIKTSIRLCSTFTGTSSLSFTPANLNRITLSLPCFSSRKMNRVRNH